MRGIQLLVRLQLFSPIRTPPPAWLLVARAQFTFPLASRRATRTLSSPPLSAGRSDAWEPGRRRTNLTRQSSPLITPPHTHTHILCLSTPLYTLSALYPLLSLLSSFYLLRPLICSPPLSLPVCSSRAPAFSLPVSLMAWLQAVLRYWKQHGAWGVIWY